MWPNQYNYGVYISVKNNHKPLNGRKPLAHLKVFHPYCWVCFSLFSLRRTCSRTTDDARRTTNDDGHKAVRIGHLRIQCDQHLIYGNTCILQMIIAAIALMQFYSKCKFHHNGYHTKLKSNVMFKGR